MQIKAIQFSKQAILDLKTLDASVISKIKRITNQLSQQDFSRIKKIKKSNPPLFRARVQNLRVFFDYHDGEIRILSVLKRNERTYKNIPLPSFFREFQNVSLDALECEDVDYLPESYYEYDGLPKCRLTSENLPSQEEIEAFIESKYQFFPVLDREQEEFISMVMNNPKVLWSIRGAAGSGKSLVMMELAMNIANFKGEKVLIFVPNRRLVERYMDFLTRVNEEKILDPRDISFNNSIEKFLNDEQHKILVSDIYTFMQSIAKMKKFSPQDIKEALKERMKYSNNKKLKNADIEIVYELLNYFMLKNKKISMKNNLFAEYRVLYENLSKELNADKYKALKRKINKADHSDLIDLATKKIEKITVPHSRKFHIFIDEVQDFSEDEFQFLFELYEKLNKKEDVNFTFCGDTNQAVRLNGFEFGKMMRIISSHGFNVKKKDFKKNYRTSRLISQAANYLVKEVFFDVFKKENGKKIENIVDPDTVTFRGAQPRIAVSSTKTIKEAFSTISGFKSNEKPILIVEDESLKRLFPKGLNASDVVINISPSECKGLEFDKITLLDLFPKKPSHYSVSRLYTSLTRARFDAFLVEPLEKFESLSYK